MRHANFTPLSALLLSLAVTACANTPLESVPAKDNAVMTTSESVPATSSKLTPEQMLTRLLELIRGSRYRSEFTPERVSQVMGVEVERVEDDSGDYSFYERVSPNWLQGFDSSKKYERFMFSFDAIPPGSSPDMADVCHVGLDAFSAELESMGFSKTPHYDSAPQPPFPGNEKQLPHGRLLDYTFERIRDGRGEMLVIVYPGYVWDERAGVGRDCVKMVHIF